MLLLMLFNSGEVQNFEGIHLTRKENNAKQGWFANQIASKELRPNTIDMKNRRLWCFRNSAISTPTFWKYYVLDSPEKNLRYEGLMVGSSLSEDVKC